MDCLLYIIGIKFGDRSCYTYAFILPDNAEPWLGAIPLKGMDLAVIPSQKQTGL